MRFLTTCLTLLLISSSVSADENPLKKRIEELKQALRENPIKQPLYSSKTRWECTDQIGMTDTITVTREYKGQVPFQCILFARIAPVVFEGKPYPISASQETDECNKMEKAALKKAGSRGWRCTPTVNPDGDKYSYEQHQLHMEGVLDDLSKQLGEP